MKRFLGYGLLGLLAFLLFLLLRAPAGLVVGLFDERLPGLNVQAVDGTVLKGSAWGVSWRDAVERRFLDSPPSSAQAFSESRQLLHKWTKLVIERVNTKREVQDILMGAMRRRKTEGATV